MSKLQSRAKRCGVHGVPLLTIRSTTTNTLVLAWPSAAVGFFVQLATELNSEAWSDAGFTPADDGATKSVVLTSFNSTRFYRLKK
jgi:hypothetical protein